MRIGLHLSAYGTLSSPERIATLAERAEALGFDSLWIADHILYPVDFATIYPYGNTNGFSVEWSHFYDPLSTLAWVAGRTQRVELGTSVLIVPMRNPVYLAKQAATIDRLSGGRLVLGSGVGWLREEFEGVDAPSFDRRGEVADEWIGLMKRLWSGEAVQHQGEFYQHGPIIVKPTPARPGGPPVVIGGVGERAIRRAAEHGDGWLPVMVTPDRLAEGASTLRARALALGRDPDAFRIYSQVNLLAQPETEADIPWRIRRPNDAALAKLRAYQAAGCHELIFGEAPHAPLDLMLETIEWVARDLRPRLND